MLKKLLLPLIISIFGISAINIIPTHATGSYDGVNCSNLSGGDAAKQTCLNNGGYDGTKYTDRDNKTSYDSSCTYVLGMPAWNCGVNLDISDEGQLKTEIWKIVANIASDISIIATYLAVGFVIYGGYKYMFASGDVGKVTAGKKTLNQAFIGLAIAMSASVIIGTIRTVLTVNNQFNCDPLTGFGCFGTGEITSMITNTIQWAIGIAGTVSLIFVVGGGIFYMTSAGDPSQLSKAKNMIKYSLIGLIIVGLSEAIVAFMTNIIK